MQRGLLALPSDIDRAMREASKSRTATDTDSYAFFVKRQTPTRGRPRQYNTIWTVYNYFQKQLENSDNNAPYRSPQATPISGTTAGIVNPHVSIRLLFA